MIPEIETKTATPPVRPGVIHRQRLVALLDAQVGRRMSVVAAPSGYGKTTLLADWASTQEGAVCWLALDPWDAEPASFYRGVRSAIRRRFPSAALPPGEVAAEPLQEAALVIAAVAALPDYVTLVIDDFHLVEEMPDIAELVSVLIGRAPPNLHVAIVSRLRPKFPGFARLVAQGEALLLGPADLAFNAEEIRELFRAKGQELAEDDAARLLAETEGWGAALALASAGQRRHGAAAIPREDLFEYLAAESLTGLTEDDREFLRCVSVLPVLTPQLCDALLDRDDSASVLTEIETRALFLSRVSDDPPSYRLHQLFRAFLAGRLRASDETRFRDLTGRAVLLLIGSGRLNESLELAWEIGVADTADALDAVASRFLARGDYRTLLEWLDRLPAEELAIRPRLRVWRARALVGVHRADEALAETAAALQALTGETDAALLAEVHLARAGALRFKGDLASALSACDTAMRLLRKEDAADEALVAEALESIGYLHGESGDFKKALGEFERALRIVERLGQTGRAAKLHDSIARCHAELGNVPKALRSLELARAGYERSGNLFDVVMVLNNTGMLHFMAGQFEESLHYYARCAEAAGRSGNARILAYQQAGTADTYLALGEFAKAVEVYEQASASAREVGDGALVAHCRDQMAVALLSDGQEDRARLMFETGEDGQKGTSRWASRQVIRGRFARRAGRAEEALGHFQAGAAVFVQLGMRREEATARFLSAAALFDLRRRGQAAEELVRTALLCQAIGFHRFLQPEVRRDEAVARYAASRGIGEGMFQRLLEPVAAAETPEERRPLSRLRVFALGVPRVLVGDREISEPEWRSEKAKEMLLFFLIEKKALSKGEVFVALWPELPESKCNSNFHSTLHRLRNAVSPDAVRLDSGRYHLSHEPGIEFDVDSFRAAANAATAARGGDGEIDELERAYGLYDGPFYDGFYAEWVEDVRANLESQFLSVASRLGTLRAHAGNHTGAIDAYGRVVAIDPYQEVAAQGLMAAYVAMGDRAAAIHHYRRYEQLLRDEVGAAPPAPMARLYETIRAS